MNLSLNKHEDLEFKNNIAEISSISLECLYDVVSNKTTGNFLITGEYRSHEISLNKDNFEFKVPFEIELDNNVISSSVLVNIDDFTYDISGNSLSINIDYTVTGEVSGEETLFEERESFEKFLDEHEVDVIDLNEEKEEEIREEIIPEIESIEEPTSIEVVPEEDEREIKEAIMESVEISENTYITYHVHVVNDTDTIDTISKKYNVSIQNIKEYNEFDELTTGMKLVIPCINE